jgi:putative membrane protein
MRGRDIALVTGLVILVVLLFGLLGGGMMGYGGGAPWGGWMGPGMMGGYGFGGGILMLVFWVLVIGGIVLLAVRLFGQNPSEVSSGQQGSGDRALDTLRERYARGEITKEQFDQMRKDLG